MSWRRWRDRRTERRARFEGTDGRTGRGGTGDGVRSIIIRSNGGGGATRRADGQIHNVSCAGRPLVRRRGFLGRRQRRSWSRVIGGVVRAQVRRRRTRPRPCRRSSQDPATSTAAFCERSSPLVARRTPSPLADVGETAFRNQSLSGFANLIKFPDRARPPSPPSYACTGRRRLSRRHVRRICYSTVIV